MKFRFPGLAELCALFTSPTSVAAAVVDLNRAVARVQSVVAYTQQQTKIQLARAAHARGVADTAAATALRHTEEGLRAVRVATNLKELIA